MVLLLAALLFGCIAPVKLAVTPVSPAAASQIEQTRVTLGAGEEFLWARVSPDGRTVVAAIATKAGKPAQTPVSFAAYDLSDAKELWRVQLAQKNRIDAENAFFVGNDKIALLTEGGFMWNSTLMMLDRATGRELWRTPRDTDKPIEPAHFVIHDPQQNVFLAGSTTMRLIDANTGQVLATRQTNHRALNPRVTGGIPVSRSGDLYVFDNGLMRVSPADRKFVWSRKFATFAEDDYMGANVGLAIAGALLGGGGGNIPPDYLVGRTTEPAFAGNRVIVGGLGRVYAIDSASGDLAWAQDLAVPQIARVAIRGDRVYVLAGGNYIFWHGRQGMSVREPVRYGLYALNLSDGKPVASFKSPFNPNAVAATLAATDVEKFNEDSAFEEEEDWGDLKKTSAQSATTSTAAAGAFSKTRLVDAEVLDNGLLVLTDDAAIVLDDNGGEVSRHALGDLGKGVALERAGDAIVLRAKNGAAAFSSAGAKMWQRKIDSPLSLSLVADGYVPLVRTTPWRVFRDVETKHFGGQVFWLPAGGQLVVLPTTGSKVMGVRVRDGQTAWEVPIGSKVGIENGYIISINEGVAELHRIAP